MRGLIRVASQWMVSDIANCLGTAPVAGVGRPGGSFALRR